MSEKNDMQVEDLSASAKVESKVAYSTALPEQKAFFKIPARFGHVPVAEEPAATALPPESATPEKSREPAAIEEKPQGEPPPVAAN